MSVDPNRASFVQQEYRYESAESTSVRANFQTARQYVHNTNLNASDAAALANRIFAESGKVRGAFSVEVEGIYLIDAMDGGPLRFEVESARFAITGKVCKVQSFECDPLRNRTVFEVQG